MVARLFPDFVEKIEFSIVNSSEGSITSILGLVTDLFEVFAFGFPVIVFSGWPAASYGTFGGVIAAVETSVSDNGKFRLLVIEDKDEKPWPKQLRMGGGANGIALLKDVAIGYEIWRNINGFPPEYYKPAADALKKEAAKKK